MRPAAAKDGAIAPTCRSRQKRRAHAPYARARPPNAASVKARALLSRSNNSQPRGMAAHAAGSAAAGRNKPKRREENCATLR